MDLESEEKLVYLLLGEGNSFHTKARNSKQREGGVETREPVPHEGGGFGGVGADEVELVQTASGFGALVEWR